MKEYLKVSSPHTIFVILALLVVTGCTSGFEEPIVVDQDGPLVTKHTVTAFCLPGPDVDLVKEAFVRGSEEDYLEVMKDRWSTCYDVRLMGSKPMEVVPVRRLFDACSYHGTVVTFWLMKDVTGEDLVSWKSLDEPCRPRREV